LKKFSAIRANRILKRSGPFWQHESYDHVIRDAKELENTIWYVLFNPVHAGLVADWEKWNWTYCKKEYLSD
jgi:putative transposase